MNTWQLRFFMCDICLDLPLKKNGKLNIFTCNVCKANPQWTSNDLERLKKTNLGRKGRMKQMTDTDQNFQSWKIP